MPISVLCYDVDKGLNFVLEFNIYLFLTSQMKVGRERELNSVTKVHAPKYWWIVYFFKTIISLQNKFTLNKYLLCFN